MKLSCRLLFALLVALAPAVAVADEVTPPGRPADWGSWVSVALFINTEASDPDVALFEDGRFAVVWAEPTEGPGSPRVVRARGFSATGVPFTDAVDLMTLPVSGDGHRPRIVAADNRGTVYVAFLRGDRNYSIEERTFPFFNVVSSVSGQFSSGLEATDLDLARHPGFGVVAVAQVELYTGLDRVLRLRYQHDLTPLDGSGAPVVEPLELAGVTATFTPVGRLVIGWAHADATHTRIDGVWQWFGNADSQQPLPNLASMPFEDGQLNGPVFAATPESDDLGLLAGMRHSLADDDSVGLYSRACGWATCKGFRHLAPGGTYGYDLDTDARGFGVSVWADVEGIEVRTLERFGADYLPVGAAAEPLVPVGYALPYGWGPAIDVRANGDFAVAFHFYGSGGLHVRRFRSAARLFYDGFESGSTATWSETSKAN